MCPPLRNSGALGLALSAANATTFVHDLCLSADLALEREGNVTVVNGSGMHVALHSLSVDGVMITCLASITVTPSNKRFESTISVQSSSESADDIAATKRDCIEANIDDLLRTKALPALR